MNDSEDGYEYRVAYDTESKCNCPDCPNKKHTTKGIVFASANTLAHADKYADRAWAVTGARNVRIERREITEWEEFLI